MRCEVVAIGTELLLGIINDTNSSWIGEQLALSGIDCFLQVKVGDNFGRIEQTIRTALERADAVICCGGLGPTQDDITRDVIAAIMGGGMMRDEAIAAEIERRFVSRGRTMSANNLRQADVPVGARPIEQMPGTAPGLVCPVGDKVIYAVPGVPREMRIMMEGTILPDLRARAGDTGIIRSRVLRSWGISESGLAEMLQERIEALDESGAATIAFQASGIEGIKVRLVAKRRTEAEAIKALDEEEAIIRPIIGDAIFGVDDETMEHAVLSQLGARSMTLGAVETLTGGLLTARLTGADPDMAVFHGGLVKPPTFVPDGAITATPEDRVMALAAYAREFHGTSAGIAAVAPEPDEGRAPGTIVMGVALGQETYSKSVIWYPDRDRLRNYGIITTLDFLRKTLAEVSATT
ncbi:MAG: CinA family nicotinamide mononucleotide deamidase-related protein [Alphaproteobacteria bacterium]|nr:CinA family nicotinamide mononucleotide deamidase-related protein [Alphaproteobacteria bacterium]